MATCSYWKAYGKINTIHWLKTFKVYEGKGLGRAVLSVIMRRFKMKTTQSIFTQPGSFRAIKLYSDFGFQLLKGGRLGTRMNELEKCLPILKEFMPKKDFDSLEVIDTPHDLIKLLKVKQQYNFDKVELTT